MRVLALDSTTRAGSVALVENGEVVDERLGDSSRSHGERLPSDLEVLGAAWSSIDVFGVCVGPGSFTGLRIGIATMQGLALVTGTRLIGISALDALAQFATRHVGPGSLVAAWIDAQRGEVFSALYRVMDAPIFTAGRLVQLEPAAVAKPAATFDMWADHDLREAMFIGDAAWSNMPLIEARTSRRHILQAMPLAGAVGLLAEESASRGSVGSPAAIQPLYVRRPDAELHREQSRPH
jgi:tRNA threonylcarbamoyladenosine biosynthesis protein TsaB